MAKTKQTNLTELIPVYGEQNAKANELKEEVDSLKATIKAEIKKAKKENTDIIVDGWKCSLAITDNSEFNEARLIEFCKQNKIDVVRTKEYVDATELERLIFNGLISKETLIEMDKCKDKKDKETLRCTKVKGE